MMQETNDPEERKQYADIVEENNRLLLQLISDILDLSKIEAGTFDINPKEMEARQLCTDLVNSFQGKAKTGVEILLAPDLPALSRFLCLLHKISLLFPLLHIGW